MNNLKKEIKKLEIGLKSGYDIYVGNEKLNVFDANLLLVELRKEVNKK